MGAMADDKLLADEARRTAQHTQVKSRIEREVNAEIAARGDRPAAADAGAVTDVAVELRDRAIHDVSRTEHEVARARGLARLAQVADYLFAVVYSLLAIRLFLALIAARPGAPFTEWIRTVTNPLYAPFRGILPSLTAEGGVTLALPVALAIGMYAVLHLGVRGLLRLIARPKATI